MTSPNDVRRLFAVSHQGSRLAFRQADGSVVHRPIDCDDPRFSPLVLLRVEARPDVALAMAAGGTFRQVHFAGPREDAFIHGLLVCRQGAGGEVAFRHPLAERFLCALPLGDEAGSAVTFDRHDVGGWEIFTAVEAADVTVAAELLAATAAIMRILGEGPIGPARLLAWSRSAGDGDFVLAAPVLLQLATPAARRAFGALLLDAPDIAERFRAAWPADRAATLLREQIAWAHERSIRKVLDLGPDAPAVPRGHDATIPTRLLSGLRASVAPRRSLAVLSSARNEGIYFLDWIAHHRTIGVEHFLIYSNDNDDGSEHLLEALASAGVVTYVRNALPPGAGAQQRAFRHALLEIPELLDFEWTAIIDIDEFIVLDENRFDTMTAFLNVQGARGADSVALNWRMFTSGGQHLFADVPVPHRLTQREPALNPHIKSIVRSGVSEDSTPHAPVWPVERPGAAFDAAGHPHHGTNRPFWDSQFRPRPDAGPVWINHYLLRSLPEYVWKSARNRGDAARSALRFPSDQGFLDQFLTWFSDPRCVEDVSALSRSSAVRTERAKLAALPGIARAHANCVDAFGRLVTEILHDVLQREDELPDALRPSFVRLVRRSLDGGVVRGRDNSRIGATVRAATSEQTIT